MVIIYDFFSFQIHVKLMKQSRLNKIDKALPLKVSASHLCFLSGGEALRCACEGLFPCFSADCLSGETGVRKIKFVNDDNTIAQPEDYGEKI